MAEAITGIIDYRRRVVMFFVITFDTNLLGDNVM